MEPGPLFCSMDSAHLIVQTLTRQGKETTQNTLSNVTTAFPHFFQMSLLDTDLCSVLPPLKTSTVLKNLEQVQKVTRTKQNEVVIGKSTSP